MKMWDFLVISVNTRQPENSISKVTSRKFMKKKTLITKLEVRRPKSIKLNILDILEACPYHYHYLSTQIHLICTVYFTSVSGSVMCTLYTVQVYTLSPSGGGSSGQGSLPIIVRPRESQQPGADTYKQTHHDPDPQWSQWQQWPRLMGDGAVFRKTGCRVRGWRPTGHHQLGQRGGH